MAIIALALVEPDPTAERVREIGAAAAAEGGRLVGHPATLERLSRALVPFGPMIRSSTATALALRVEIVPDPTWPEGLLAITDDL